ncbi:MAG: DUF2252 family protein [Alphaproteobacteria bacterium]|nr:DUF2252 family protein [Alphaproteobacteria bacterium]
MASRALTLSALAAIASLTAACADVDAEDARQAWLVEALLQDNLTWLSREPELLERKYATMAADPYDYMRGTAGVFFQDISRPGTERSATTFVRSPTVAEVLLVGDPHPENLGTFRPGPGPGPTLEDPPETWAEGVYVDFNDLDGSHFGPYLLDLRRAAVGLTVLALPLEGCEADCADRVVDALARAYVQETLTPGSVDVFAEAAAYRERLDADDSGDTADTAEPFTSGGDAILRWILDEAIEEGPERKKLHRYAEADEDGELVLLSDEALDEDGGGMLALTREEAAQVERLAAAYAARAPEAFRLRGAVRRYGSGVASQPAVRYVWLWDRGEAGPADDQLMVVREVVDPSPIPGIRPSIPGLFDSQAQRIEGAPLALWARPDADFASRGLTDEATTFKAVSWTSWFQGFDHADIADDWADGDYVEADLIGLARVIGAALAGAHGRAPTASGADALPALQAELLGEEDPFADELVMTARADAARCLADQALFLDALDDLGPLLGAERLR